MAKSIGDILDQFIRSEGLEKPLLERRIVEMWPQVMGEPVARLTGQIEIKDGTLYVHVLSAALRQQLFECRFELVKRLNDAVHGQVIRDIRLLG